MILLGTINRFLNWNKLHKVSFSFKRYMHVHGDSPNILDDLKLSNQSVFYLFIVSNLNSTSTLVTGKYIGHYDVSSLNS